MTSIIAAAVVAGGQSLRMGRDKAALRTPDGRTLLERTVAAARSAGCAPLLVVGRERPVDWPDPDTVFVPDKTTGLGPAGGLLSALENVPGSVLLLPCDLPRLSSEAVAWLVEAFLSAVSAQTNLAGVAATTAEAQVEPLFGVYTPLCLPPLEARLLQNRRSLQGLIEAEKSAGRFVLRPAPPFVADALFNANTPQEWETLVSATASADKP